jgi:hypothetical protein
VSTICSKSSKTLSLKVVDWIFNSH